MQPKWRRIRDGLKERGLDGALIFSPENLHYAAGYASAIASVLFAIVVAATALQMRASKRWVHYA